MVTHIMSLIVVITSKLGLANAVENALSGAGYTSLVASNANQAIDLLAGQSPALILLGDTTQSMIHEISILKTQSLTRNVPIVLQSNNYTILSLAYQQRLGVQAALSNPYSTSHLIQNVKQWLAAAS